MLSENDGVQEEVRKSFTQWADSKDSTAIHYCTIHLEVKFQEKRKRQGSFFSEDLIIPQYGLKTTYKS